MLFVFLHGVLGPYDELIFLSIAVIFLLMMGVSWVMSRNMEFEEEEFEASVDEMQYRKRGISH